MSGDASEELVQSFNTDRSQLQRRFRIGSVYRDSQSGREMQLSAIHSDRIEGYLISDGSPFQTTPLDFVTHWAEVI